MTAALQAVPVSAEKTASQRLASIDTFRGLTMVVMIFVNDLASVRGLPWWNYHMKADIDFMTYVDMVYPFFLFAIGLAIPLAIRQRLKKNSSLPALWQHVIVRSFSLLVLGLILANADTGDRARMGMNTYVWAILALAGASLFLNIYKGAENHSRLHFYLRMFGLGLVIVMLAIFRRTTHDGNAAWLDFSYPEILGLIACTYFAVCLLYILTRRWVWAPLAWFVVLVAFNAFCLAKWITFPNHVPIYFWPFNNGAMACITMGGIVTSAIFMGEHRWKAAGQKITLGLIFGIATLSAGWILAPLGISKIRATPTWSLYSVGIASLLFALLYWLCDIRKMTAWAFFARPAGANTLLTYLLPDFYYFIVAWLGVAYFERHFNYGRPGAVRAAVFTAAMLAIAALVTKWKVRLQL
ncbi:MAG TPA: DUF5009 domain-containing protein [Terriglobales bacterium]|jgi:predicted acyltransferase